jgi:acyl carrier protein
MGNSHGPVEENLTGYVSESELRPTLLISPQNWKRNELMEQIKTALREIFVETLRLPMSPTQVGEEDLVARLGIDSIGLMEIITRVENRFHIIVEDADVSPTLVNSFDTLATYIAGKKKEALP